MTENNRDVTAEEAVEQDFELDGTSAGDGDVVYEDSVQDVYIEAENTRLVFEEVDEIEMQTTFTLDDGAQGMTYFPMTIEDVVALNKITAQCLRRHGHKVPGEAQRPGAIRNIVANPALSGVELGDRLGERGWMNVPWGYVALAAGVIFAIIGLVTMML